MTTEPTTHSDSRRQHSTTDRDQAHGAPTAPDSDQHAAPTAHAPHEQEGRHVPRGCPTGPGKSTGPAPTGPADPATLARAVDMLRTTSVLPTGTGLGDSRDLVLSELQRLLDVERTAGWPSSPDRPLSLGAIVDGGWV